MSVVRVVEAVVAVVLTVPVAVVADSATDGLVEVAVDSIAPAVISATGTASRYCR